jgi:hypothetical protein
LQWNTRSGRPARKRRRRYESTPEVLMVAGFIRVGTLANCTIRLGTDYVERKDEDLVHHRRTCVAYRRFILN